MDDSQLPHLTRRQEEILSLIIRAYTQSPEPVSSKSLSEQASVSVSSATIRNEMAVLEELGYIAAPHTSAGRVPTENGYRYFVRRLLHEHDLGSADETRIAEKLDDLPMVTEQWMRRAAAILARTARTAALVTAPSAQKSRFKHIELIAIQGRLVLMVLVLQGSTVHQQMLHLTDAIPQQQLSDVAQRINTLCTDLIANEMRMKASHLELLDREICELAADLMDHEDSDPVRLVYREGLSDVVSAFQNNSAGAQQAVRVFEERAFLGAILSESPPELNEIKVMIGGEGRWEELRHLSMVLSRYGIPGQASGTIGVLGPIALNYGRAISAVRHVAGLMTDALTSIYDQPDKPPPSNE